jgi:hypothetical protein
MVTALLGKLQRVAVTVAVPAVPSPVVVPTPLVPIEGSRDVFVMLQVTSLRTLWGLPPVKVACAVNVIAVPVPFGTDSGLAVIVRFVNVGQAESVAVAGVSAW